MGFILLYVLFRTSAISSHAIAISSNEEEESIVISLDESGDLPSVKYTRHVSTCWLGDIYCKRPTMKG